MFRKLETLEDNRERNREKRKEGERKEKKRKRKKKKKDKFVKRALPVSYSPAYQHYRNISA